MTQSSHDEDRLLLDFLRQNRPLPPQTDQDLESQILHSLAEQKQAQPLPPWWLISGAVACLVSVGWGLSYLTNSPRQIATNPQEVEDFLWESWHSSVNESPDSWGSHLWPVDFHR